MKKKRVRWKNTGAAKQSESSYKRTGYRPQWEAILRLLDEECPGYAN